MIFWCLLSILKLLTVCLSVKVYWLMTPNLSTPQKWKDRSIKDLDFRLCILGVHTIKRGWSMKYWGEIKSYTLLHPFAIWLGELCRNPTVGDFLGGDSGPQSRRLRPVKAGDFDSEPETPTKESGLPNSVLRLSGASLGCLSGVFERTPQRLRGFCTREPETPVLTGRRLWVTLETLGLVDPNG
jgi:hypothetical protein